MLNLMIGDIQRIFRHWIIYACIGGAILFSLLIASGILQTIGTDEFIDDNWTQVLMSSVLTLIFIILMPVSILSSDDCSNGKNGNGTIKNVLATGFSRSQYYITKLITAWIFCLIIYSIYIVGGTLFAILIHGFDGTFDFEFIMSILRPASLQLIILIAFTSLSMAVFFIIQNTTIAFQIVIALIFVPALFAVVELPSIVETILSYELATNLLLVVDVNEMPTDEIIRTLAIVVGYIIISTIIGLSWFKRMEIK